MMYSIRLIARSFSRQNKNLVCVGCVCVCEEGGGIGIHILKKRKNDIIKLY